MRVIPVLFALALPLSAVAVPMEFSHQGRMMDAIGVPLDGPQDVEFLIYDTPAGGTAVWTELHTGLQFDDGFFSAALGSSTSLDPATFDGDDLFVTLVVNGAPELPTRTRLRTVPFAVRANSADSALAVAGGGTVDATEILVNGTTVIDSSGNIDYSSIVNAPPDTMGGLSCAADQVAAWDGSVWACADNLPGHNHDASEIATTTVPVARLPVGTSSTDVAAGDHVHSAADVGALPVGTTAADIGALPTGATAADVGALPDSTTAADIGAMPDGGGVFSGDIEAADITATGVLTVGGLDVEQQLFMAAARSICYGGLAMNTTGSSFGMIMTPFVRSDGSAEAQCTSKINSSWHACGLAKGNYYNQSCGSTLTNTSYNGGGYTSFVRESVFQASINGTYSNCNQNNAMICCSPSCTAGW